LDDAVNLLSPSFGVNKPRIESLPTRARYVFTSAIKNLENCCLWSSFYDLIDMYLFFFLFLD